MTKKLYGVVPAIGAPLTDGDRIDVPGLQRLVRYLLSGGVHGLLANGSMGGFAFLTNAEQIRAIATTVETVAGAIPVIGGLGETGLSRAIPLAREIARQGVDGISLLPPFYFFATQENLIAWFSEIAAAVDIPVYLYDNPALTKQNIRPETVVRLRDTIPHLAGMKVSNQDCINLQQLLTLLGPEREFSVLTGSEFLAHVHLSMGCDGMVGGLYNLCPHLAVAVYQAFRDGDTARAAMLQTELIEAWQLFTKGAIWGGFDEALRYLGICDRATGAPYISGVTEDEKRYIHDVIDRHIKPHAGQPVS
jgi:4-hydroxy-tetrahydrodipicolinate synthase